MRAFGHFCRRYVRNRAAVAGLVVLLLILLMAGLADVVFPDDPWDMVAQPLLWPGQDAEFPLGSDLLGRNLMSGLFHGTRVSLVFGFSATLAAVVIGVTVGVVVGYYRGWADDALMRVAGAAGASWLLAAQFGLVQGGQKLATLGRVPSTTRRGRCR